MQHLTGIIEDASKQACPPTRFKVYLTGHSLGGALAVLAAYDIQQAFEVLPLPTTVVTYTVGAPRVGNHSFARSCNTVCPDSWSIINDQDIVARQAKFLTFKRSGERVLINAHGDMVVRPTFMEMSVHNRPGASSVSQHLLASYRASLLAICHRQLDDSTPTRRQEGQQGVSAMLRDPILRQLLNFDSSSEKAIK